MANIYVDTFKFLLCYATFKYRHWFNQYFKYSTAKEHFEHLNLKYCLNKIFAIWIWCQDENMESLYQYFFLHILTWIKIFIIAA